MKKNAAIVTLLVDESGSMGHLRKDTIGSMNTFIDEQRKVPGECEVRVVTFETRHRTIRKGPLATIGRFTEMDYNPSGGTALYDALTDTMQSLGRELAALPESERPENVFFVIITDGEDNSSKVTASTAKEKIQHQMNVYNWKFIYLGAGLDAFQQGNSLGFGAQSVASYTNTSYGYNAAMSVASTNLRSARTGGSVYFTDEQRKSLSEEDIIPAVGSLTTTGGVITTGVKISTAASSANAPKS